VSGFNYIESSARLALTENGFACGKMPRYGPLSQESKFGFREPRKNWDSRQRLTVVDFDFRHSAYFTGGKPAEMVAASCRSSIRINERSKETVQPTVAALKKRR
jgi:hypothetical protein